MSRCELLLAKDLPSLHLHDRDRRGTKPPETGAENLLEASVRGMEAAGSGELCRPTLTRRPRRSPTAAQGCKVCEHPWDLGELLGQLVLAEGWFRELSPLCSRLADPLLSCGAETLFFPSSRSAPLQHGTIGRCSPTRRTPFICCHTFSILLTSCPLSGEAKANPSLKRSRLTGVVRGSLR